MHTLVYLKQDLNPHFFVFSRFSRQNLYGKPQYIVFTQQNKKELLFFCQLIPFCIKYNIKEAVASLVFHNRFFPIFQHSLKFPTVLTKLYTILSTETCAKHEVNIQLKFQHWITSKKKSIVFYPQIYLNFVIHLK